MDHTFCPGSTLLRQPAPEIFTCLSCGGEVEIWTDELKATCPSCLKPVYRDAEISCLDWCKRGKECVGDMVYDSYMKNKAVGLKKQLLEQLRDYFGNDKKRVGHAERVLEIAEALLANEQGDWHIVIPASILHDVGIKVAEEKYGSSAGPHQEKEGPPVAREILLRLGFCLEDIDEICDIIAHHHSPGALETQNFKVLYDSDCLVNLKEQTNKKTDDELRGLVEKTFLTTAGKKFAMESLNLRARTGVVK